MVKGSTLKKTHLGQRTALGARAGGGGRRDELKCLKDAVFNWVCLQKHWSELGADAGHRTAEALVRAKSARDAGHAGLHTDEQRQRLAEATAAGVSRKQLLQSVPAQAMSAAKKLRKAVKQSLLGLGGAETVSVCFK